MKKKTALEVAKTIKKIETEFQANLEEMYISMHRQTFKQMRRFWPISKKPMEWDLRKHNLTAELGKKIFVLFMYIFFLINKLVQ